MTLFVRADDPSAVRTLVAGLRDVEPDLPVTVAAMEDKTSYSLIPLRLAGSVIGIAGVTGLFLATTGIFGIIAYTVSRESRDIAIRVALGAEPRRVGTMIAARSVRLTFAGVAIGLVIALFASRLLSGMLFGVAAADPVSLAPVTFVFAGVSAIAAWAPARRAAGLDPARLLHEE